VDVALVEAPLERRIGQDDVEAALGLLGKFLVKRVGEGVLVVDVRVLDAVEHQVHRCDAQHRRVEVEPMEHRVLDVVAVRLELIAGVDHLAGLALQLPLG
jgi:hypothetical protein